jgi:hypothetical protein
VDTDVVQNPNPAVITADDDDRTGALTAIGTGEFGGDPIADVWDIGRPTDAEPLLAKDLGELPVEHGLGSIDLQRQHPALRKREGGMILEFGSEVFGKHAFY